MSARAEARYRRLLRLLPPSVRREATEDLVEVFRAEYARVAAASRLARARFWIRVTADVCVTALGERRRARHRSAVFAVLPERRPLLRSMRALARELSLGLARLWRHPLATLVAAGTLALGLATAIVAFVLVRDVLLRPLPFADSGRLVRLLEVQGTVAQFWPSYPNCVDWRDQATVFDGLACVDVPKVKPVTLDVVGAPGGEAERRTVARASRGFFTMLGIRPAVGRWFAPSENRRGGAPVALVSWSFWRQSLGAQPLERLGLTINRERYAVVGVLPAGFRFLGDGAVWSSADVWTPMERDTDLGGRESHGYHVVARLAPGVTLDRARSAMNLLAARLKAAYHGQTNADRVKVTPLFDVVVGSARAPLRLLAWAGAIVLLIACLNLAAAILAGGLARARELSVRLALGARRADLVRHVLVDAAALALPAVAVGLVLAGGALRLLRGVPADTLPRLNEVAIDWPAALAAVGLALGTALLAGLLPALVLSRRTATEHLRVRGVTPPRRHQRLWFTFVSVQAGLTLLLVAGTGLLLKSLAAALAVDLGYRPAHVLAVDVSLPAAAYRAPERRMAYYEQALAKLGADPSVESAAVTSVLPEITQMMTSSTGREGQSAETFAGYRLVSPGYFATLGIPVITVGHPLGGASAFVDRTVAGRVWKQGSAMGGRFFNGFSPVTLTVAGIVGAVREWDQESGTVGMVYVDYRSQPDDVGDMHFVVRYRGDAAIATAAVRRALTETDPLVPLAVTPLEELATASMAGRRLVLWSAGSLAAVAALLAIGGIYALVAFAVTARLRDAAIRMALGARPGQIVGRLTWLGVRPALAGLLLASLAWPGVESVVRAQLFRVRPTDPLVLTAAAVVVLLGAAGAAAAPARRARRIDPVRVLQAE